MENDPWGKYGNQVSKMVEPQDERSHLEVNSLFIINTHL